MQIYRIQNERESLFIFYDGIKVEQNVYYWCVAHTERFRICFTMNNRDAVRRDKLRIHGTKSNFQCLICALMIFIARPLDEIRLAWHALSRSPRRKWFGVIFQRLRLAEPKPFGDRVSAQSGAASIKSCVTLRADHRSLWTQLHRVTPLRLLCANDKSSFLFRRKITSWARTPPWKSAWYSLYSVQHEDCILICRK